LAQGPDNDPAVRAIRRRIGKEDEMTGAIKSAFRPLTALLLALQSLLVTGLVFAQSQGIDINVNTKPQTMWYGQWWVWALGVAVFLIIIVALTSRGRQA
jgi:hypothetical protein